MSDYRPLGVIGYPTSMGVSTSIPLALPGGILRSPLPAGTTLAFTSGWANFICVGYRPAGEVIKYVRCGVSGAGSGAQTAEVAVGYSTTPPTGSAMTLTKLWADGTLDALTATGAKGNTTANAIPLPCDAWVWLGLRTAMATTQPTVHILQRDWVAGWLTQDTGVAVLTSLTSFSVTPTIFANTAPDLRGYL